MKNLILIFCLFCFVFSCKKKSSNNDNPVVLPDNSGGNSGKSSGVCDATLITEMEDGKELTKVSIVYNGTMPSDIKVDSNGQTKVKLKLDERGSIKSGTIPFNFQGNAVEIDFTSTNTYTDSLLTKAVMAATSIRLSGFALPGASATITTTYTYDANKNLTSLLRKTVGRVVVFPLIDQKINRTDSILYSGYQNGRPSLYESYSIDDSGIKSLSEAYQYDEKGNRTKISRNGNIIEENVFTNEIYPARIAYLLDPEGNPNYRNKDQDANFFLLKKSGKNCSGNYQYEVNKVSDFQKSGSCITKANIADTTVSCSGGITPGLKSYLFTY